MKVGDADALYELLIGISLDHVITHGGDFEENAEDLSSQVIESFGPVVMLLQQWLEEEKAVPF